MVFDARILAMYGALGVCPSPPAKGWNEMEMLKIFRVITLFFAWFFLCCLPPVGWVPLADAAPQRDVIVGTYKNAPLVFKSEQGEIQGFFVDVIQEIARKENWRLVYQHATWAEQMDHLKAGRIDPKKYNGFAFGWGVERTFMMKEGMKIDDIRILYKNDLRFLKQF